MCLVNVFKERKIFELPEWEKMILCERHRAVGNYLFQEGLYPKAAEQYQLVYKHYNNINLIIITMIIIIFSDFILLRVLFPR